MNTDTTLVIPPDKKPLLGCELCSYGIVEAPDFRSLNLPQAEAIAVYASIGRIQFCTCEAGTVARTMAARRMVKMQTDPFYARPGVWQGLLDLAATPAGDEP